MKEQLHAVYRRGQRLPYMVGHQTHPPAPGCQPRGEHQHLSLSTPGVWNTPRRENGRHRRHIEDNIERAASLAAARPSKPIHSRRNCGPTSGHSLKDVLVAPEPPAGSDQRLECEPAVAIEAEDVFWLGHFEGISAHPVNEIMPAAHPA